MQDAPAPIIKIKEEYSPLRVAADVAELILLLKSVDINAPLAKLNETTITDNNGGRIEL